MREGTTLTVLSEPPGPHPAPHMLLFALVTRCPCAASRSLPFTAPVRQTWWWLDEGEVERTTAVASLGHAMTVLVSGAGGEGGTGGAWVDTRREQGQG